MKKHLKKALHCASSINLTIILLCLIGLLVLIQNSVQIVPKAATAWPILKNLTSSNLFVGLLILFCVNLLACSLTHLLSTIKTAKAARQTPYDAALENMPIKKSFSCNASDTVLERLTASVSRRIHAPACHTDTDGADWISVEQGRFASIGFYLAHLSLLSLVIGVILSTQGFHYLIDIGKNQTIDPLLVVDNNKNRINLGFGLHCETFSVPHQPGSQETVGHQSTLSILEDGKKTRTKTITFGNPLNYSGISIYQNRFSREIKHARIVITAPDKGQHIVEVKNGQTFTVPGTRIPVRATSFKKESLQLISLAPRARLWISKNTGAFTEPDLKKYRFTLQGFFTREMTNLKIIKDPGRILVWYGFLSMIAGFGIMFFYSHRRLLIKTTSGPDGTSIVIGASATKNRAAFKKRIAHIQQDIERI